MRRRRNRPAVHLDDLQRARPRHVGPVTDGVVLQLVAPQGGHLEVLGRILRRLDHPGDHLFDGRQTGQVLPAEKLVLGVIVGGGFPGGPGVGLRVEEEDPQVPAIDRSRGRAGLRVAGEVSLVLLAVEEHAFSPGDVQRGTLLGLLATQSAVAHQVQRARPRDVGPRGFHFPLGLPRDKDSLASHLVRSAAGHGPLLRRSDKQDRVASLVGLQMVGLGIKPLASHPHVAPGGHVRGLPLFGVFRVRAEPDPQFVRLDLAGLTLGVFSGASDFAAGEQEVGPTLSVG